MLTTLIALATLLAGFWLGRRSARPNDQAGICQCGHARCYHGASLCTILSCRCARYVADSQRQVIEDELEQLRRMAGLTAK